MKVIASQLRKGNVVEIDDKLYVILTAQNFHPGKGTPVTQVDMRRISDGTKVSERWKTTDQVERAHVDEREYDFLYEDGEGYHFMEPESYEQITVPEDGLVVLQARDARQRRPRDGAAAYLGRNKDRGEHRRRELRRTRQGLTARFILAQILPPEAS